MTLSSAKINRYAFVQTSGLALGKVNRYAFVQTKGLTVGKMNRYVWVVPIPAVVTDELGFLEDMTDEDLAVSQTLSSADVAALTSLGLDLEVLEDITDEDLAILRSISLADVAAVTTMGLDLETLECVDDADLGLAAAIPTDGCGSPESLFFAVALHPSTLTEAL